MTIWASQPIRASQTWEYEIRQDKTTIKKKKRKEKISFNLTSWLAVVQRHKCETWQTTKAKASSVPLLLRLYPSFHTFTHFTFFQFHTKLAPLLFQLFSTSTFFSLCDCASTLFFYLLFLVLSVLNSLNQSSSFSAYMLHTPHSTALLSHFSISHHPQATQPRSCLLLTHLRGVQPQIINEGEGKLNHFHHSLKSLNVFSFWIDFLILWFSNSNIVYCSANIIFNCLCVWLLKKLKMSLTHCHLDECLMFTVSLDILNILEF